MARPRQKPGIDGPPCDQADASKLCADALRRPVLQRARSAATSRSLEFKSGRALARATTSTYAVRLPGDPVMKPKRGRLRRDLELRAPADVLVRADALRLRVGTRVHEDVHAGLGREQPRSSRTRTRRTTSASTPATRSWSCSSTDRATCRSSKGFGCAATRYCAAMTIDSFEPEPEHGRVQQRRTATTSSSAGPEPISWAYVTKSGVSQAPADPLFTGTLRQSELRGRQPGLQPGSDDEAGRSDQDPPARHAGRVPGRPDRPDDATRRGSMTASVANGFAHVLYEPDSSTCHSAPYALPS